MSATSYMKEYLRHRSGTGRRCEGELDEGGRTDPANRSRCISQPPDLVRGVLWLHDITAESRIGMPSHQVAF